MFFLWYLLLQPPTDRVCDVKCEFMQLRSSAGSKGPMFLFMIWKRRLTCSQWVETREIMLHNSKVVLLLLFCSELVWPCVEFWACVFLHINENCKRLVGLSSKFKLQKNKERWSFQTNGKNPLSHCGVIKVKKTVLLAYFWTWAPRSTTSEGFKV